MTMQNAITDYSFFSAGAAVFTVANAEGEHHTFRVSYPSKDGVRDETGPLFVGHLTGPNNDADYSYMGIFDPRAVALRLTKASRKRGLSEDAKIVKVFVWVVRMVRAGKSLPEGYTVQHEGMCGRCGRRLTTPASIETGIGPICAEKMMA
jgi:hypothetical protein